jgi:hypothetical protein
MKQTTTAELLRERLLAQQEALDAAIVALRAAGAGTSAPAGAPSDTPHADKSHEDGSGERASDEEEDPDALEEEEEERAWPKTDTGKDPEEVLGVKGAFVADFRLKKMPKCVNAVGGMCGEATLYTERDSSSVLRVPAGASIQCQHASAFDQNDSEGARDARRDGSGALKRLHDFTIVLDLKFDLSQLETPQALVPLGHTGRPDQPDIIITKEGDIKSTLSEFAQPNAPNNARIVSHKWHRVVIAVDSGRAEMNSYIDGKLCGTVTHESIRHVTGIFTLSPDTLSLFSSNTSSNTTLALHIRRLVLFPRALTPDTLPGGKRHLFLLPATILKFIGQNQRDYLEKLSLFGVTPRPVFLWQHGAYHGIFMDKFLAGGSVEGRDVASAIKVFRHLALSVLVACPASSMPASSSSSSASPTSSAASLLEFVPKIERTAIRGVLAGLEDSIKLARKVQNCTAQGGEAQVLHGLLKTLRTLLLCLQPRTFLLVPIGLNFEDHQGNPQEIDVILAVECEHEDRYRVTVVNVSQEGGVGFHSVFPSALPNKNRYCTGLELGVFKRTRIIDMSFWMWGRTSQKSVKEKKKKKNKTSHKSVPPIVDLYSVHILGH